MASAASPGLVAFFPGKLEPETGCSGGEASVALFCEFERCFHRSSTLPRSSMPNKTTARTTNTMTWRPIITRRFIPKSANESQVGRRLSEVRPERERQAACGSTRRGSWSPPSRPPSIPAIAPPPRSRLSGRDARIVTDLFSTGEAQCSWRKKWFTRSVSNLRRNIIFVTHAVLDTPFPVQ